MYETPYLDIVSSVLMKLTRDCDGVRTVRRPRDIVPTNLRVAIDIVPVLKVLSARLSKSWYLVSDLVCL